MEWWSSSDGHDGNPTPFDVGPEVQAYSPETMLMVVGGVVLVAIVALVILNLQLESRPVAANPPTLIIESVE